MSKNIFVFAEQRGGVLQKVGIELLGKANELVKDLGQEVVVMLPGDNIKDQAEVLFHHGTDKAIVVDDPMLREYVTEPYAKAIFQITEKYGPKIVLYGATSIGRDLTPGLAARVHTGLTADYISLGIDEESKNLMMTRPAFGGDLMATILCEERRPQMATVCPGVMTPLATDHDRKGELIEEKVEFSDADMNVTIREIAKEEEKKRDTTETNILVSGGHGIGGSEGFKRLQQLAEELNGEVSTSHATVDADWIEKDRQVGQAGKTVHPDLYFAFDISGATQHLTGMEESDLITAINKNDTASIFDVADLGIVGDLNAITPKLIEEYQKEKAPKEEID